MRDGIAVGGRTGCTALGYTENKNKEKGRHKGKAGRTVLSVLFPIFTFLGMIAVLSLRWVLSQWSGLTMDEIIYQLEAPLEGTGNNMVPDYMIKCLVPALVCTAAAVLLLMARRKKAHYSRIAGIGLAAMVGVLVFSVVYFGREVKLLDYIRDRNTKSDFIENHYVDPSKVELTFPKKKRNLVQIYMESTEVTFADKAEGGDFDQNVIPEITKLAQENEDFAGTDRKKLNGGLALPGATWTMGAIFGMASGLPLNIDIERNSMSAMTSFFPQITTMGDLLKDEGYRQVFVLGSDATFGGRRLYFQQHGDFEIRDYVYAKEKGIIPENYKVWWGMEDEKTIAMAKDTLTELASGDQPFNLTLLTVDTHFPDGYVCELCGDTFDDQYSNVFACSSRQISELVKWIQQQDWYDNTTIMITGDHPTMDADYCAKVPDSYSRRTYTCYINADAKASDPEQRRDFSTFDNFPTTLAALGVKIEGNRLGLGVNLFSDEKTLLETYGDDAVKAEVSKKTDFIEKMEQLDPEVEANVKKYGSVRIKSETYDLTHGWISISTDPFDIPADEPVKYIHLKIWVEKGGQIIRRWIQTKELDGGGYYTTFDPLKDLDGYPEIYYQFVIKFDNGTSYNLGPQGTIRNLPGHTYFEESGTGDAQNAAGDGEA